MQGNDRGVIGVHIGGAGPEFESSIDQTYILRREPTLEKTFEEAIETEMRARRRAVFPMSDDLLSDNRD